MHQKISIAAISLSLCINACIYSPPRWYDYEGKYKSTYIENSQTISVRLLIAIKTHHSTELGDYYFSPSSKSREKEHELIFEGFRDSGLFSEIIIGATETGKEPDFLIEIYVREKKVNSTLKDAACIYASLMTITDVAQVAIAMKSRIYDKQGSFRGQVFAVRKFTDYNKSLEYDRVYRDLIREILLESKQKNLFGPRLLEGTPKFPRGRE